MWCTYIRQLKAEYFDVLHKPMEQWKKDIILTNKHNHIAKLENENRQLWRGAPIKTKEGVIEYWKQLNGIKTKGK